MFMNRILPVLILASAVAAVVAIFIAPGLQDAQPSSAPPTELNTIVVSEKAAGEQNSSFANAAIIDRENDGHYWTRANVDGTEIKFMVDTGASTVALTYRDAQRLGLKPEELNYTWTIRTAGGETKGASVLLKSIRIGNVEVENVEAMILREGLSQSLLGMTFLGELYSYEFKRKQLIIRQ